MTDKTTATETLRQLLDERGVEWDYGITGPGTTRFDANGVDVTFTPMRDGLVCSTILTPEQAVEATLGRGTCKMEYVSDFMSWHCEACDQMDMAPRNPKPRYCKWCGRKVEQ